MSKTLFIRLLLGLSLAFNIAILVSCIRHNAHPGRPWDNMPGEVIERLTRNLSATDTAAVHRAFDAKQENFAHIREKMHGDLDAADAAMQADPFDLAALRRAMDDVHRDRTAGGQLIEDCILDSAQTISPDGRAKLFPPQRDH